MLLLPSVLLLLLLPVTKQRRQTFVSGVNSLRGTLPWIAPEIVKNPDSVTEKVCQSAGQVPGSCEVVGF